MYNVLPYDVPLTINLCHVILDFDVFLIMCCAYDVLFTINMLIVIFYFLPNDLSNKHPLPF